MTDLTRSTGDQLSSSRSLMPNAETRKRRRRWRRLRDGVSRYGITTAGFGVVFSLALIFVYLFYEVIPVFKGASIEQRSDYAPPIPEGSKLLHVALERHDQLGVAYSTAGSATFFQVKTGQSVAEFNISLPAAAAITSFAAAEPVQGIVGFGLNDGGVVVRQHQYDVTFPEGTTRQIDPVFALPYGESALRLDPEGRPLVYLSIQQTDRGPTQLGLAGVTSDGRLLLNIVSIQENMLTGERQLRQRQTELPRPPGVVTGVLLDKGLRNLFVATQEGQLHYMDISTPAQAQWVDALDMGSAITAIDFLVASVSIITGLADGQLVQSFVVRDDNNDRSLKEVRRFKQHPGAIVSLAPEYTRKGFLAGDETGTLGIHYGTSTRTLFMRSIADEPLDHLAMTPRNDALMTFSQNKLSNFSLWNEHPQLSFKALWNRVWYEGQTESNYTWQSSSARDEVESKFSLMPLTLGTIKAATYAMMFAMPLGLMGAIYTAYFMSPRLRGSVKPVIEVMEALPTVILGFLAGLWLAPFVENHLPAVFSIFILVPLGMLGMAALWQLVPNFAKWLLPRGWEFVVLIPVVVFIGWGAVAASPWVEILFFDGSLRQWLTNQDITYDQRNALVVGMAMGFAVIPGIYSIAEDAVFNVPKHLTQGSLALGATPWQTVVGVVIPTASPGMFSALMIGMGRAVGETMIVLMATGNSPVMNFNIFEGMRTLSANIAVELPETAVGGSHFRILFLAALVLFLLTFILNTAAEIVRQRLRRKYSSL